MTKAIKNKKEAIIKLKIEKLKSQLDSVNSDYALNEISYLETQLKRLKR